MRSETIVQDMMDFARECFTALLFAVLLLVTGCGSSRDYSPRAEIAPPPPFMTAAGGNEMFGPPVPLELQLRLALLESISAMEPAAGDEADALPKAKCTNESAFPGQEGRLGFGRLEVGEHGNDLSFARLHSGRDSPEMTVHVSFALSPAKKPGCR